MDQEPTQQDNRPARETPNYGLPVPGDAGPADYVADTGALADAIDEHAAMFFPGDLRASASRRERPGWLLCDGREVRRDFFPDLFAEIGEDHGAGDGQDTFNLPNFIEGRMALGVPAGRLGERGGNASHTLTVAELAHHAHGVSDPTHAHGVADPGHAHTPLYGGAWFSTIGSPQFAFSGADIPIGHSWPTGAAGVGVGIYGAATGIGIHGEGGNAPHNNMPPYIGVNVFIKT